MSNPTRWSEFTEAPSNVQLRWSAFSIAELRSMAQCLRSWPGFDPEGGVMYYQIRAELEKRKEAADART